MNDLNQQHCAPCEGGTEPMKEEEIVQHLKLTPEWEVKDGEAIEREFTFEDFRSTLDFVNRVGDVAEEEGHHPDILIFGYKHAKITLSTHAIGGLSTNDFILASKIDRL